MSEAQEHTFESTPLRERIAKIEAAEAREHMAPVLAELQQSGRLINACARNVEEAARHMGPRRMERSLTMVLIGVMLGALLLTLLQRMGPAYSLSEAEQRRLRIGARIERVWETLAPKEQAMLQELLNGTAN